MALALIPFIKYLTADNKTDHVENEVLIVLIPDCAFAD
jgi:hypothetical protein